MNGWKEDRDQDKSGFTTPSSRTTQRTRTTQPSFYQTSDSKTPIRSENKNKKENAKEHIELPGCMYIVICNLVLVASGQILCI